MHHKRNKHNKTSTRRGSRRADMKSYRQQESRAMDDMEVDRVKANHRTGRLSYCPEFLPLGDVACNASKHGKKKSRPKKEKCPVNGTHEWYHETITEKGQSKNPIGRHWECDDCKAKRNRLGYYGVYCDEHTLVIPHIRTTKTSTCIHCWTVKAGNPSFDDENGRPLNWWSYRRTKTLTLKKRPLDLVSGMTLR